MSHTVSLTKIIYDPARLRTPNIKEVASSSEQSKDVTPNQPILMDEFGQTPDHFYLARKPPPSFFQVKRKLNLQTFENPDDSDNPKRSKRRRKTAIVVPKPRGRTVIEKPRYDTSLGQLTKKFLKLLSDAADGVINLNTACTLLSVPKRRLYDITNVLEGAGLIQKTSRNNIQWMGRVSSPCSNIVKFNLEKEIDILEAKENKLDELIYHMKAEINAIKESEGMYHYVTTDDLKNIQDYAKKMIVGVKIATSGQMIEAFRKDPPCSIDVDNQVKVFQSIVALIIEECKAGENVCCDTIFSADELHKAKKEKKMIVTSKTSEIESFLLSENSSFVNILHPRAEFKENSYNIKISNNQLPVYIKEEKSPVEEPCYRRILSPYKSMCSSSYARICAGTWSEGDTVIKNAFITEEDDIAPMGKNFLLQTEDQDFDALPFAELESHVDSYSFSLDDGEGLTDLFDCHFSCP